MFDKFSKIHEKVTAFIYLVNNKDCFEGTDICIETEFPKLRQRRTKRMPGEKCTDEINIIHDQGPLKRFEIETYKVIINQITQSLTSRFTDREETYKDFFYFDPRNFKYF